MIDADEPDRKTSRKKEKKSHIYQHKNMIHEIHEIITKMVCIDKYADRKKEIEKGSTTLFLC